MTQVSTLFFVSTNVLIVQQRSLYQKRHRVAHFVSNFVALAIFALFFRAICGHVKRSDCRKLKNTNCKLITLKILLKSRSVFSTFLLLLCFSWCLFLFSFFTCFCDQFFKNPCFFSFSFCTCHRNKNITY